MLQDTLALDFENELSEADWRVLAAIIDTEGSIYINKMHKDRRYISYDARIQIQMTSQEFINFVYSLYKGSRYSENGRHDGWKSQFRWCLTGFKAIPFLHGILPHLIIKKKQAELALELLNLRRQFNNSLRHPAFLKARGQAIYDECGLLNKRGFSDEALSCYRIK